MINNNNNVMQLYGRAFICHLQDLAGLSCVELPSLSYIFCIQPRGYNRNSDEGLLEALSSAGVTKSCAGNDNTNN